MGQTCRSRSRAYQRQDYHGLTSYLGLYYRSMLHIDGTAAKFGYSQPGDKRAQRIGPAPWAETEAG